MAIKLSNGHFKAAAAALNIHPAIVKSVAMNESPNAGFDAKGRPIILFERHKFYKYVGEILGKAKRNEIARANPDICNAESGGYGPAGEHQWKKFSKAFRICPQAAMMSCSWGSFQEMGFNYESLGFDTVDQFVDAMKLGLEAHLAIFIVSIRKKGLLKFLRKATPDFHGFAEGYNGSQQEKNDYEGKMKRGYNQYKKEAWDSVAPVSLVTIADLKKRTQRFPNMLVETLDENSIESQENSAEQSETAAIEPSAVETTETKKLETEDESFEQSTTVKNEQDVNKDADVSEPEPQGFKAKLAAGIAALFGGTVIYDAAGKVAGIQFSTQTIFIICFLIFIAFLGFCVWAVLDTIKKNKRTEIEAMANTAIDRKNIRWVKPEKTTFASKFLNL